MYTPRPNAIRWFAGSLLFIIFFFIRWFAGSPLKWGFFGLGGVLCLWCAVGTLVLETWAPAPASSGGDGGGLFQGLNDAHPLPAKIEKVAYRAPAAQLKNWQPTDLHHSLAVKIFGFRSQFLKCCVPWLRQKVLMSTAVSSCTEGRLRSQERA